MTDTECKPSDILDRAADVLGERGWTRFTAEDTGCHVCALGALGVAATGSAIDGTKSPLALKMARHGYRWDSEPDAVVDALSRARIALAKEIDPDVWTVDDANVRRTIWKFNDYGAKDRRYVIRKLRKAAAKLRKAGR